MRAPKPSGTSSRTDRSRWPEDRRPGKRQTPRSRPEHYLDAALLAAREVKTATLVGSSSGAGLAIDFAFRHPDQVERLVLLGPVVHGMATSRHFAERGAKNNAPLAHGDVRGAARNWARDRFQIAGSHEAARRTLFETLVANPRDLRYQGNLELHFMVPASARIGEIHVPTLIRVGFAVDGGGPALVRVAAERV